MPRPDRHNEIEINLLHSGSLTYLLGGTRTTIQAGRMGIFWAGIPHQIVGWEGAEPYHVVTLPLGWFLASGLPAAFAEAVMRGVVVSAPTAVPADEANFRQWEADLESASPVRERAALLEIHARLLRLAEALPEQSGSSPLDPKLSKADQLACYIARHYQESLTAEEIAKANGVHPNYAMTLFRQAFGTTITDFIVQHRISHAQRLLVSSDDSVVDIAFASGFQSLSRFNEVFKKLCSCPPREFRRVHRKVSSS